jgi:hypothetical protein
MHPSRHAANFRLKARRHSMAQQTQEGTSAKSGASAPFKLPSAKDLQQQIALAQSEKASEALRHAEAAEKEKKALLDRLSKPSGLSDDEVMRRAHAIIERAVKSGHTSVQVTRFPNQLCTDRGRAINQAEPGWEETLTGVPKEIYAFWHKHLRPLGYRIRFEIVDFPNGMPGDVGITLSWG